MTQFLENNTYIITTITSLVFCLCSIRLAAKEDERYTFSSVNSFWASFITVAAHHIIYSRNENVAFITIFLMTAVIAILSVSLVIDVKLKELPDKLTLLSLGLAIPFMVIANHSNLLFTFSSIAITTLIAYLICRYLNGLGFGDVKLLVPILLFVPPVYFLNYWFNAIIIGLIMGISIVVKNRDRKATFAFGPALILGLLTVFTHVFII